MRLLSLQMSAYGPFTDWSIDLSKGVEGLHLIFGPNEAGKSAALRGLKALLFGIDERTADNFLHDNKKLRIAGTLRKADGGTIEMVRRKGRANTLLAPDGSFLDGRIVQDFLGGVSPETFSRMFGLGHEELTRGGREIVSGKGDVGQSLFVAALGGQSIQQILEPLEKEAAELFAPRASARLVHTWLDQYQQAMKEAKEASLQGSEWEEHKRLLREMLDLKTLLAEDLRRVKAELARSERIRNALPCLAQKMELQLQRARLGEVLLLPEGFSRHRRTTLEALARAREAREKAGRKLQSLTSQIDELAVPMDLLNQADGITRLYRSLGSYSKAMQDLPKLTGEAEQIGEEAGAILNDIRPGAAAEPPPEIKIGLAKRQAIRELSVQQVAHLQTLRNSKRSVESIKGRIEKALQSLANTKAPRDPAILRDLLKRARGFGDLEAERSKTAERLAGEAREAELELLRLPLWKGTIDALEKLCVPEEETVSRLESRIAEIEQSLKSLKSRMSEVQSREAELAGNLKQLELTSAVPTEDDLKQSRQRREIGWKLIRGAWLDGRRDQAGTEAFAGGEPLHQAYEKSVHSADEVADRLRREADRVAQHAGLLAERERAAKDIRRLTRESDALSEDLIRQQNEWQEIWRPSGIHPLPPREMRSWIQKQRTLIQRAAAIRAYRQELQAIEARADGLRGEMAAALENMGEKMPAAVASLHALIDYSQTLVEDIDAANSARQKLEAAIFEMEGDLTDARREVEDAEANLLAWQSRWAEAVKELALGGSVSPEAANLLLDRVKEFADKTAQVARLQKRVEGIHRDSKAFAQEVRDLSELAAPDLMNVPPELAVSELHARLARARENEVARKQLQAQREELQHQIQEAGDEVRQCEARLELMCAQARCSAVEELEAIELLSDQAGSIDAELKSISSQLLAFAGGGTVEDLVRDAHSIDPDSLPQRIADLRERVLKQEEQLSQVEQNIGRENAELARMDGSSRAADAAEKAQSSLAQIRKGLDHYVRLRLASTILRGEIERYRAKNQGPVLKRASDIFAALTLGSFAGLRTNYDEHDRPVLVGVRSSGKEVEVDGMSDGTCDQLYLSLRLASLEKHIEEHEPMPFILDDILINFDDGRSEAALNILAGLSEKTQVIFFTHHQHLISLALRSVADEILQVHRIGD